MADIKKPLATIELAAAAVSLVKTAAVIFTMMLLEWARLAQRKAEVNAEAAKNDLEVEKLKNETKGVGSAQEQIDSVLHAHGLPGGTPGPSAGGDGN